MTVDEALANVDAALADPMCPCCTKVDASTLAAEVRRLSEAVKFHLDSCEMLMAQRDNARSAIQAQREVYEADLAALRQRHAEAETLIREVCDGGVALMERLAAWLVWRSSGGDRAGDA